MRQRHARKIIIALCGFFGLFGAGPCARRDGGHDTSLSEMETGGWTDTVRKQVVALRGDGLNAQATAWTVANGAVDAEEMREELEGYTMRLPLPDVTRIKVRIPVVVDVMDAAEGAKTIDSGNVFVVDPSSVRIIRVKEIVDIVLLVLLIELGRPGKKQMGQGEVLHEATDRPLVVGVRNRMTTLDLGPVTVIDKDFFGPIGREQRQVLKVLGRQL